MNIPPGKTPLTVIVTFLNSRVIEKIPAEIREKRKEMNRKLILPFHLYRTPYE